MTYSPRTQDELETSLDHALARAPPGALLNGAWLLVYGSMLENPPFVAEECQPVLLEGWERAFCLADPKMRGTLERPGLSLGLVPGRHCHALAYRLAAITRREDLIRVWKREMVLPFYVPCWLEARTHRGVVPMLTFCVDDGGPLHEPSLAEREVLARLTTCAGESGTNAEYLETTVRQLTALDIPDPELARLLERVRATRTGGLA